MSDVVERLQGLARVFDGLEAGRTITAAIEEIRQHRATPKPTFLPLMRHPCRSVERESAEANAKAILDKTCAELRLKNNG